MDLLTVVWVVFGSIVSAVWLLLVMFIIIVGLRWMKGRYVNTFPQDIIGKLGEISEGLNNINEELKGLRAAIGAAKEDENHEL